MMAIIGSSNIDVYSGNDDQVLPILSLGGQGVISVLSNIAPEQVHAMCESFFSDNLYEARNIQFKAIPLIEALFCEVNPIPIKWAMNYLGLNVGSPRMPLTQLEGKHIDNLEKSIHDFFKSI